MTIKFKSGQGRIKSKRAQRASVTDRSFISCYLCKIRPAAARWRAHTRMRFAASRKDERTLVEKVLASTSVGAPTAGASLPGVAVPNRKKYLSLFSLTLLRGTLFNYRLSRGQSRDRHQER